MHFALHGTQTFSSPCNCNNAEQDAPLDTSWKGSGNIVEGKFRRALRRRVAKKVAAVKSTLSINNEDWNSDAGNFQLRRTQTEVEKYAHEDLEDVTWIEHARSTTLPVLGTKPEKTATHFEFEFS